MSEVNSNHATLKRVASCSEWERSSAQPSARTLDTQIRQYECPPAVPTDTPNPSSRIVLGLEQEQTVRTRELKPSTKTNGKFRRRASPARFVSLVLRSDERRR